jgi:predicted dehydrogenase
MAEPLRWGVIGSGRIASSFVADLVHTSAGRAVAIGSRSRDAAEAFGDRFSIPHRYSSYEALVADPDVDAVYIATPHPLHYANACLALEAGKPALVEKPFTMSGAEARRLVGLARKRRVFLMEAMWTRFLPHIAEIRRLQSSGELGQIVTVMAEMGYHFPPDPLSRLFAKDLGGGALLDLGIYPVSLASMLLGRPASVTTLVEPAFSGVDGTTSMLFGYRSGAHCLLSCSSTATSPTRATIVGTKAYVELDRQFYSQSGFELVTDDGVSRRFDAPVIGRGLWYEAEEVARCLGARLTESPLLSLDESVAVMETMDEVLASATSSPS